MKTELNVDKKVLSKVNCIELNDIRSFQLSLQSGEPPGDNNSLPQGKNTTTHV